MAWNKVGVVGAGLIKMGELFDQSYEQMAAGAFNAAVASVDKGFAPTHVEAAVVATQRGTRWGQEGIGGNTVPSAIGLTGIACTRIENACPSGSDAFWVGAMAVASGVHDVVLVHPQTRLVWSFHKWSLLVDAGGAHLLPRLVGLPRAKAMVLLGEGRLGTDAVDLVEGTAAFRERRDARFTGR